MSLSATDSLNIIGYYGEMELTTAEKKVRIVMAEQLQETVSKYYDTVRAILADEKASKRKKDLLLAAAVVSLKNAYLSLFDKYYLSYINAAGGGSGEPYSAVDAWKRRRAYDFALWITQTAQREPNVAFSESHAAAVTRTEVNAVCNLAAMDAAYRQGKRYKTWKTFGDVKVILILNLRIGIFASISRLSLRQVSLAYIQYACVDFPHARHDLAANLVYTPIKN